MDQWIGQMLDNRYEILEVIGVGGMAMVYKAKCHRLNRYVAIKILKEEYAQDDEFRRQFHDESQSVAMLSHPNIVAVYDVSRAGDVEYIVMELIDGITLKEYLRRRGPLTWQETTFFSIQIAKALEHAHSRGIIHRDIKPQNIMLLRDGTLKVADFGIARHMTQQKTYNISEAIGSVHYVAPEQAKGSHIDNRADIYSFGVVMYEMLTGRLPFEGDSPVTVALQHINSIPLMPSDYVTDIPKTLEDITMRAMSPAVSRRYGSAGEMLDDLERFRSDPDFVIGTSSEREEEEVGATRKLSVPPDARMERKSATPRVREPKAVEYEEPSRPRSKKKSGMPRPILYAVLAVCLFVFGACYFIFSVIDPFGGDKEPEDETKLTVPKLVGQQYSDVIKNEEYKDFFIDPPEEVYDDQIPAGQVISQNPLADRPAEVGMTIQITVSKGPKVTSMVNLKGIDYRQAEIELDRMDVNITYIEQYEFSEDIPKDAVISTTPEKGTELKDGDKIVLVISKGPEPKMVVVPDLSTMTEDQARSTLLGLKLEVGNVTKVDSDKPDGQVIFQSLPAKSKVEEGTSCDIQISRNPEPVKKSYLLNVTIISVEEPVEVEVKVNGETQYTGTHYAYEGSIQVPLVGIEGSNTVRVIQNGETTLEEAIEF